MLDDNCNSINVQDEDWNIESTMHLFVYEILSYQFDSLKYVYLLVDEFDQIICESEKYFDPLFDEEDIYLSLRYVP